MPQDIRKRITYKNVKEYKADAARRQAELRSPLRQAKASLRGSGSPKPIPPAESTPGGVPERILRQQNRVVQYKKKKR